MKIPTRDAFNNLRADGFVANIQDSPKSKNTDTRKQLTIATRLRFNTLGTVEGSHFWRMTYAFSSNYTPKLSDKDWAQHIMVGDYLGDM